MPDTYGKEERIEEIRITEQKVVLVIILKHTTKKGIYEIIEGRKSEKKIIVINIAVKVEGKIKKN